ncbi:Alpha/beta hydrolase family [Streptoalloteichus tenebrarius]|uniref:Alpha/beta hydrolase family n=1 Tax=Streptoalloteichus tenebrarius (strain ATCC 17920 / DSM 40477 / JCM 4838 / CBS 697.72 / NBRC 16177 / NCIMB 11028 / NRRL B-12390 / A12253. 1 / ISP 5477) TaxID=1933 RepID=A0ABT1HRM0_STRSD|nr:hypothetical protein [Streptoalloteichus tenebrarius]MCP2258165.1 Alpha/beta hydrolase family [Streptoalloteichus tenebrarius]BFF04608.1 hypothetical protein GCM10020241_62830 [Streptoalloteichus tenebrarius]
MRGNPAIVLVHGFWGGAAHWANVIVELDKRGYDDIHAVENPLTSLADDASPPSPQPSSTSSRPPPTRPHADH